MGRVGGFFKGVKNKFHDGLRIFLERLRFFQVEGVEAFHCARGG